MSGIEAKTLDRALLRVGRLVAGGVFRVFFLVLNLDLSGGGINLFPGDVGDAAEAVDEVVEVEILNVCGARRVQGGAERVVQAGIELLERLGAQVRDKVVGHLRFARRDIFDTC